jgi:phage gpG-like protein
MSHVSVSDTDKGMASFLKTIRGVSGNSYTKVGLPEESEPAVVSEGHSSTQIDLIRIGAIHEFGAPNANIPERSFIRSTFDANSEKLKKIKEEEAIRIIAGQSTPQKSLARIGEWMATKIKLRIKDNIPPKLSPYTIAKKGSDVALIDSGQLIQSITHVEVMA